jgi:flagellar biosynthesis anti-sigma factor FlgM
MRIDLNAGISAAESSLDKAGSSKSQAAAAPDLAESQFSPTQESLATLFARALAMPEVRQEKVQALQTQIQNGTYQVSPAQIAASMLEALRG